jgi:hypothetical protein
MEKHAQMQLEQVSTCVTRIPQNVSPWYHLSSQFQIVVSIDSTQEGNKFQNFSCTLLLIVILYRKNKIAISREYVICIVVKAFMYYFFRTSNCNASSIFTALSTLQHYWDVHFWKPFFSFSMVYLWI